MRRNLAALAALTAAIAFAPSPALAANQTPPEHYDDVFDILLPTAEDPPGSTFCGLLDVPLHGEVRGTSSGRIHGNSPYPYFSDRFKQTFVYTNPTTHKTFTTVSVGQFKDQRIVDNGDGTITITHMVVGTQDVFGPAGELLLRDRGLFRETVLIGTNGTVDPDDDVFLGPVGEPTFAGPHGTATHDFCDDFLTATA